MHIYIGVTLNIVYIIDCCKSYLLTSHFLIMFRLVLPHSTYVGKIPFPIEIKDHLIIIIL